MSVSPQVDIGIREGEVEGEPVEEIRDPAEEAKLFSGLGEQALDKRDIVVYFDSQVVGVEASRTLLHILQHREVRQGQLRVGTYHSRPTEEAT